MAAYVIVETGIHDPAGYEEYKALAAPTVALYGGKYLARGGKLEVFEGEWQPTRLVVLEFPSLARAKEWFVSPEYAPIKEIRHRTAKTKMVVVEGL